MAAESWTLMTIASGKEDASMEEIEQDQIRNQDQI